ncbi:MAG: hypothetical protein AAF205_06870 [Pseudomonadota bacterium]
MMTLTDAMNPFTGAMRAFDFGRMWNETMAASAVVLAKRAGILYGAAENPMYADLHEIGRMMPEKLDAFGRGLADAGRARDPMEAAERMLKPVHARATANARRLRGRR